MIPKPNHAKTKAARKRREATAYTKLRAEVYDRDCGRCRVCRRPVKWVSDNPWDVSHTHHLVYRSRGGQNSAENCILLCPYCHRDEHEHRLKLTGTSDNLKIQRMAR